MDSIQEPSRRLTGVATMVMLGTLLSRITGFLRNVLITTQMKPMGYSDEFILAFTLPDLVYDLLAGGAIAAAFIPILSTYLTKGKERTGWKAISTFINLSVILMVILEIVFFVFTDSFLGILASGYREGTSGDGCCNKAQNSSKRPLYDAGRSNEPLSSYKRFAIVVLPVI